VRTSANGSPRSLSPGQRREAVKLDIKLPAPPETFGTYATQKGPMKQSPKDSALLFVEENGLLS
jgi:hypothetical protein